VIRTAGTPPSRFLHELGRRPLVGRYRCL